MIFFWYRAFWILISRNFRKPIEIQNGFQNSFRVGLFDCEGFRVMSAFKYANYVEYNRWEFAVRSPLFKEILRNKCTTATASQKFIFRKPLKFWSKFKLNVKTVGWDDKWIYNLQIFTQNSEIMAICISKSLVWKKDKPQVLSEILKNIGINEAEQKPPLWFMASFMEDNLILKEIEVM